MGIENEDESKGGDNRGQRWETVEDRLEPSETDEDKVGRMEDRSELLRGGTKGGENGGRRIGGGVRC